MGSIIPTALGVSESLRSRLIEPGSKADFSHFLSAALTEVNRLELEAQEKTRQLVAGEDIELHQVMLAAQKASLALELTQTLRNKVVEAYQEIMRMQV